MNKMRNSRISRRALERLRDSLLAEDDHPAQNDTDADADQELLYGALSQLRKVRSPGKENLTLGEAVTAAYEQHVAFQKWCKSGRPIGGMKGWIDGKEEFVVRHDLYDISFGMPPSDDAVLQITTHADGEDVVLYNLRLQDVPPDGMKEVKYLPNGQCISLTLTRGMGAAAVGSTSRSSQPNFSVKIAVNADLSEEKGPTRDGVRGKIEDDDDSATDTNKYRARFPFFNLERWLTPFPSTREWLAGVVALAIVPLCCLLLIDRLMPVLEIPTQQGEMAETENQPVVASVEEKQNESLSHESGKEVAKEPASTSFAFSTSKSSIVLNHAKHEPMPRSREKANAVVDDKTSDQTVKNRLVGIKFRCPQ
jgi:hypothetical protein